MSSLKFINWLNDLLIFYTLFYLQQRTPSSISFIVWEMNQILTHLPRIFINKPRFCGRSQQWINVISFWLPGLLGPKMELTLEKNWKSLKVFQVSNNLFLSSASCLTRHVDDIVTSHLISTGNRPIVLGDCPGRVLDYVVAVISSSVNRERTSFKDQEPVQSSENSQVLLW